MNNVAQRENGTNVCPRCAGRIEVNRESFGHHFRCPQFAGTVMVAESYSRVLVLISIAVGFCLSWLTPLRTLAMSAGPLAGLVGLLALSFLLSFVVLFALVRVAPRYVSPTLVTAQKGVITVLGLSPAELKKDQGQN